MKKFAKLSILCLSIKFLLLSTPVLFAQSGWSEDKRVTYDTIYAHSSFRPRATSSGGIIHVVWWKSWGDSTGSYDETFYACSTDSGVSWSDDILISVADNIGSIGADVVSKGDTVLIVWTDEGLTQYRRSTDGGFSWSSIDTAAFCFLSCAAIVEDTVYLAGMKFIGGESKLVFTRSFDAGLTWDSLRVVCQARSDPGISVNLPYIHIVTEDLPPPNYYTEILYVYSSDGGNTWADPLIISDPDSNSSQWPALTSWPTGVAATWFDGKYSPYPWTGDIFCRRNLDTLGGPWQEIDSLTTVHRATYSDILAERTHLHAVWQDERNNYFWEVYYRESSDLGETWQPELRLTDVQCGSEYPTLACDGRFLHLFWCDARDDTINYSTEIYYKHKDLEWGKLENGGKDVSDILTILPNPFRDKTLITFFLPEASSILEVYDAVGRSVFKREVSGKGRKEVLWQTERTGVYFIRLRTINKTIIKKVVAIR
jgi:hypothetical protein